MNDHPKWNFQEFSTFLLIYAASADFVLSPEEEALIKNSIDEDLYLRINKEYEEMTDYEVIQTILSYQGLYFPTHDRKMELIDLMKKQFLSDGVFSQVEKNLLMILEKIM